MQGSAQTLKKALQCTDYLMHTYSDKGAFKYYVIKEVVGWGQKMAIFDDLQYC